MAKKRFNVTSTLSKNSKPPQEPTLAPKVPLKKNEKDFDVVKEHVEQMHTSTDKPLAKATQDESSNLANKRTTKTTTRKTKKIVEEPEKLVRLTIDTPESMHKRLKVKAVLSGITMREYILGLLEKDLKKS